MLKLTTVFADTDGYGRGRLFTGSTIWVKPSAICTMRQIQLIEREWATQLFCGGNNFIDVQESPDDILRMPEMIYYHHPMMRAT